MLAAAGLVLRLHKPQRLDIDHYIEQKTGLPFQPLITQNDHCVTADAMSMMLWHEHRHRMQQRLQDLKIGQPLANMPKYDPYGLRSLIFLSFTVAFAYSFSPNAGKLSDAFAFSSSSVNLPQMRIDAWIDPPEYTNLAPIYLSMDDIGKEGGEIKNQRLLPIGSVVNFRIVDAGGRVDLTYETNGKPRTSLDYETVTSQDNIQLYQLTLTEDAHLQLMTPQGERQWMFAVMEDAPPHIDWVAPPRRSLNSMLELSYQIDDDYGVNKAWASIRRVEHFQQKERLTETSEVKTALGEIETNEAIALYDAPQIELILPRGLKGEAATHHDLTNHPWAGMEVEIMLHAQDGAGNIATTQSLIVTLPQRVFGNPLARAVIEQRRLLIQNPANHFLVSDMLASLLIRPGQTIGNAVHIIALQSAWTRLSYVDDRPSLRSLTDYLWQIALGIENDGVNAAAARLKQAQQALRDALRNGASQAEIERLMRQLRQAMQDYIAALAERNQGEASSDMAERQILQPDELERKLQQLEEMAQLGSRGAAEQLLSELEDLLDNLQVMQGQNGQGEMNRGARSPMQQNMDNLADQMRRQQELMNETDRLIQEWQRGERSDEDYAAQMEGLARNQEMLRDEWNALQRSIEGQGMEIGEAASDAEQAMGQARDALRAEDGSSATNQQGQALEAMRRAGQDMMQAMRDGGQGQERQSGSRDPLGRERQNGQAFQESDTKIPGEIDIERARRILDEIRSRFGHMTPQLERQYLERLLEFH